MENKIEKFLPIGSVVVLNSSNKTLMITGYLVSPGVGQRVYDYMACLYPEGVISTKGNIAFNHCDIKAIYAIGYSDDAQKKLVQKIKEFDKGIKRANLDEVKEIFDKNNISKDIFNI